ncbi:MAG: hypothetical protein K2M19_01450 [Muribaculaceae bacterium]|nr:hypothetical protein [Muribaculaceae bacterium]
MRGVRSALLGIVLASAFAGCSSSGCLDNGSSIPLAGFYSSATLQSIRLDSLEISGVGAPNDSVLMYPGANSQVYLPMNPDAESVTWLITYRYKALEAFGVTDMITLRYRALPYFASEACGAMYAYRVTGVEYSGNLIDSVALVDSLITNTDIERIKIFFRTEDAGEGDAQ